MAITLISYVDGNNDNFNSSLAQWEDYSLAGEKAYLVNGGYNFADQGLEGLAGMFGMPRVMMLKRLMTSSVVSMAAMSLMLLMVPWKGFL